MCRIYLVVFLFLFSFTNCQIVTSSVQLPTSKFSAEVKDTCDIQILYEASFTKNEQNANNKSKSQVILQIGKKFSKFLDVNTLKKDSLIEVYSHQSTAGAKEINELSKYKIFFNKNILKDLSHNKIIVQDRFKNVYQYEEAIPTQNWILTKETSVI